MRSKIQVQITFAAALTVGGCSLAPNYQVPAVVVPERFKEETPWTAAAPKDQLLRGAWWSIYKDETLSELESRLDANSPNLAAALARYAQAQAYDQQVRSAFWPTLSGILDPSRNRQSDLRPLRGTDQPNEYNSDTVGVNANYEIDLWGQVRNEVSAAHSVSQALQNDLVSAKLSLETQLAENYAQILGLDQEIKLLQDTVAIYEKALALTETLHSGGVISGLDVGRAQTQLDTARAQVKDSSARRALLEHAIAALIGEPAPAFSLPADGHSFELPAIPAGLPAQLLERRPDIAAAERRVAAANAGIGVARAAFFPNINLSASLGLQSTSSGRWLMAPASYWAIGPMITQTIFDAGLNRAKLAQAHAKFDETSANYRATVLSAFQQVEDNLALLENYRSEYADERSAVDASQRSLDISMTQYRDGGADYLEVVDSQTAALSAQRSALSLHTRELVASIDLVRAIGGGWQAPAPNDER